MGSLADNAGLVGAILDVQQASGMNRTEQTKVQMKRTIDGLSRLKRTLFPLSCTLSVQHTIKVC